MEIMIAIGQIANFEPFQQVGHGIGLREHGRHDDHGPMLRWDSAAELQPRQRPRLHQPSRQPVDDSDADVRGDHQCRQGEQTQSKWPSALPCRADEESGSGGGRDEQHAEQIEEEGIAPADGGCRQPRRKAHGSAALQHGPAPIGQVIADVRRSIVELSRGRRALGELNRLARDVGFRQMAPLGDRLHLVAVAVAGGEVHSGVDAGRIVAQDLFHQAVVLHELPPIVGAEKA